MNSHTLHTVSSQEQKQIEKEAKKIMDDFSKKLSSIKLDESEPLIERELMERAEGDKPIPIDREIMFDNAPSKTKDFILGEKKRWWD